MKHVFLLSNSRKGRRKPKASCNSVLAEGKVKCNIDDRFNTCRTIGFGLDTRQQKYVWINIPERLLKHCEHHFKPILGNTIRRLGGTVRHY